MLGEGESLFYESGHWQVESTPVDDTVSALIGLSGLKIKNNNNRKRKKSVSHKMMIWIEINILTGQLPAASLTLQGRSLL